MAKAVFCTQWRQHRRFVVLKTALAATIINVGWDLLLVACYDGSNRYEFGPSIVVNVVARHKIRIIVGATQPIV